MKKSKTTNPIEGLRAHCADALARLKDQHLLRGMVEVDSGQGTEIRVGGRALLNFASNDYLGLAGHHALAEAATDAIARFGTGSGASRLLCGNLKPHVELEAAIAELKGTEAALSFSSGYATALGAIPALVGRGDVIILDKLCHACLVDAARLSGARIRVFRHNDVAQLESHLSWAESGGNHTLVIVESIYSMDGDAAPLRAIVDAKDLHGAWLLVDEAHSTGVCGSAGAGLCRQLGVSDRIEIQMGTLSKALGASGGFVAGPQALIDFFINRARSFIFSTGPSPAAVAAATAAIRISRGPDGDARRSALWKNIAHLAGELKTFWPEPPIAESPILPLIIGEEARAMSMAAALRESGAWIPAIRYPTVARGKARLRISVSSSHTEQQIGSLIHALRALA